MSDFEEDFSDEQVEQKVETDYVKCPSCGANMVFDPDKQMLYCEHCGSTKDLSKPSSSEEISLMDGLDKKSTWGKDVISFRCENCGATVVFSNGETAKSCPFCGTAHVAKKEELSGLKPNALVPFAFGGDKAVEYSKRWAKKRLFAPLGFKKNINVENLKGVYTPCFTFDSFTTSSYSARLGTTHTVVSGSGKNRTVRTYTTWRNVSGVYTNAFDDVLISSGEKVEQKKIDMLSPFGTQDSRKYEEQYLLGFMAYQYDKDIQDCWSLAKSKMDEIIKRNILKQYHYDKIAYFNCNTTHDRVTYKYIMLPVYVANYKYKKKTYNLFVNGLSGKIAGKTPLSFWRILVASLIGVAAAVGIAYLVISGQSDEAARIVSNLLM